MKRYTIEWEPIVAKFSSDFSFSDVDEKIVIALKTTKRVLFPIGKPIEEYKDQDVIEYIYELRFHEVFACGKVNLDLDDDDLEELRHLNFKEYKGEWNIKEDLVHNAAHLNPLKLHKHNIGVEEKPKLDSIGDY